MYFSNLMGDISKKYSRWGSIPITFVDTDGVSTKRIKVVDVSDGKKELMLTDEDGIDVFDIKGNGSEKFYVEKSNLTFGDISDTEDNPLIVVSTKGIRFFYNIPTYIRALFVNKDIMLVELVFGACEFQFADGTFVALQRCNDDNLAGRELTDVLKCEKLSEMFNLNTKGGYNTAFCSVVPCYVEPKIIKKSKYVSYLCDKKNLLVFDEESVSVRLKREEEQEKEKIEKEEKLKADRARYIAEAEEKRKQKEYEMAQKKLEEQAERAKRVAEKAANDRKSSRNTGAEAFLAMLNGD